MDKKRERQSIKELQEKIHELESVNRKLGVGVFGPLFTLLDISTGIKTATELKPLIDLILYTLIGKLCIRNVSIALLDEKEKGTFVVVDYKGLLNEKSVKEVRFDPAGSLFRLASSRRKPIVITEMGNEEGLKEEKKKLESLQCVVILPLIVRNELKGSLFLGPKISEGPFTSEELDFASILTTQVAVTIDNLKLYRELRKARDYLEEKVEERTKELKSMQAQFIQSAKMAAVGQLGAGVAHELNNPLGGILGYAQFILQKFKRPQFSIDDFKSCRRYVEFIEKEANRCKNIVESMLKFSRGPGAAKQRPLDIREIVKETLSILGHQLYLENIKITLDLSPDLVEVMGNDNQLQQVFTNLILNAYQAMPKGGELKIRANNIIDKDSQRPKAIKMEFADTGCGIPKENLNKMFEPFFSTKEKERGVGLGLTVTYHIIKEHEGTIEVASEVGKGTTFTITLPAAEK